MSGTTVPFDETWIVVGMDRQLPDPASMQRHYPIYINLPSGNRQQHGEPEGAED
ncbi:MAG: hypothetical protein AB7K24_23650 [Gemmataceae bacterium]